MNERPSDTVMAVQARGWRFGALRWLWLSALVIGIDQLTKALVLAKLGLFDSVTVLPVLEITHLQNTGAAFSFLAGASGWQRWFFIGLAACVSLALLVWLQQLKPRGQAVLAIGLSLVLGGAAGNAIDRIRYGYVVDFIHVHWKDWSFPAFNVADSAITVGAVLLIVDALFDGRRRKP